MIIEILKVLLIFAVAPIVVFTLCLSFILNDAAILNPLNWVAVGRYLCVLWLVFISVSLFASLVMHEDQHDNY